MQPEAVAGFIYACELTGEKEGLRKALRCWKYISDNLVNRTETEWFWSISENGTANREDDKDCFRKCLNNDRRICLEQETYKFHELD